MNSKLHLSTQSIERHYETARATSAFETSLKDFVSIALATLLLTSPMGPACNARAATAPSGGGRYLGGLRNAKTPRTTRESTQVGYARGATTEVITSPRRSSTVACCVRGAHTTGVASPKRFKNSSSQIMLSLCCLAHSRRAL